MNAFETTIVINNNTSRAVGKTPVVCNSLFPSLETDTACEDGWDFQTSLQLDFLMATALHLSVSLSNLIINNFGEPKIVDNICQWHIKCTLEVESFMLKSLNWLSYKQIQTWTDEAVFDSCFKCKRSWIVWVVNEHPVFSWFVHCIFNCMPTAYGFTTWANKSHCSPTILQRCGSSSIATVVFTNKNTANITYAALNHLFDVRFLLFATFHCVHTSQMLGSINHQSKACKIMGQISQCSSFLP